jgi:hypothetical protein
MISWIGRLGTSVTSGTVELSSCTACIWWRNEQYVTCTQLLIKLHCNGIKKRSFWNLDPTLASLYHLQTDRTSAVVQDLTCLVYSVALHVSTCGIMLTNPNMESKWNLYKQMASPWETWTFTEWVEMEMKLFGLKHSGFYMYHLCRHDNPPSRFAHILYLWVSYYSMNKQLFA